MAGRASGTGDTSPVDGDGDWDGPNLGSGPLEHAPATAIRTTDATGMASRERVTCRSLRDLDAPTAAPLSTVPTHPGVREPQVQHCVDRRSDPASTSDRSTP